MSNSFSDKTIVLAIIVLILLFFKGFKYLLYLSIYYLNLHNHSNVTKFYNILDNSLIYVSDLLDTILLLIALYVLFIRKHNSILTTIFCLMLILKFVLHFLLLRRFEAYFNIKYNLSDETSKKLFKIKSVNSFITNVAAFVAAGYMLNIIFFSK